MPAEQEIHIAPADEAPDEMFGMKFPFLVTECITTTGDSGIEIEETGFYEEVRTLAFPAEPEAGRRIGVAQADELLPFGPWLDDTAMWICPGSRP